MHRSFCISPITKTGGSWTIVVLPLDSSVMLQSSEVPCSALWIANVYCCFQSTVDLFTGAHETHSWYPYWFLVGYLNSKCEGRMGVNENSVIKTKLWSPSTWLNKSLWIHLHPELRIATNWCSFLSNCNMHFLDVVFYKPAIEQCTCTWDFLNPNQSTPLCYLPSWSRTRK